jgi:DNA-directed RNA polymerase specialized sigma24 family protein
VSETDPDHAEQFDPAKKGLTTSPSLLERARGDDTDAWKRIVHLYGPLVDHWCQRASISRDDSEDVVQDIFLSVAKQLKQFRYDRPQDSFRGWLRVITQRRIADYSRRIADRPRAEGVPPLFGESMSHQTRSSPTHLRTTPTPSPKKRTSFSERWR